MVPPLRSTPQRWHTLQRRGQATMTAEISTMRLDIGDIQARSGSSEEPRQLDGGCQQHLAADAGERGELDRGPETIGDMEG
eukprot:Skav227879  [mRNA]  locus=scaffold2896:289938:290770:+ [translate_table: standard]